MLSSLFTGITINRHRVRYVQRLTTLKLLNKEKMATPTGHGDCATDHHKFHNLSPTADPYSPQALTRQLVKSRQNYGTSKLMGKPNTGLPLITTHFPYKKFLYFPLNINPFSVAIMLTTL